jgi:cytoskeletal protein CcmA (bactofilin family)
MWKSRSDEKPLSSNPTQPTLSPMSAAVPGPLKEGRPAEPTKTRMEPLRNEIAAHIGKSVVIKGELSGSEDLYLDGEVQGTIELNNHSFVVGPNGRVKANIRAREVVVHGRVDGNITATERVELRKSCVLSGDISTRRIVIEDGAFFKGSVDAAQESQKEQTRPNPVPLKAGNGTAPLLNPQASFLE